MRIIVTNDKRISYCYSRQDIWISNVQTPKWLRLLHTATSYTLILGAIIVIVGEKRIKSSNLQCNSTYVGESTPDSSVYVTGRGRE